jgi:beta-mannosidase
VANDGPRALRGELHVALVAGGRHAIAEASTALSVAAHGAQVRNVEAILGRFADAAYAYRFGPPAHDAVVATLRTAGGELIAQATHFPTGPPLSPSAFTLTARAGTVPQHEVTVTTEQLAWGVRVHAPGFRPGDDGFVLVPGTPRTVVLMPVDGATFSGATVTALNLIGEAPVDAADVAA